MVGCDRIDLRSSVSIAILIPTLFQILVATQNLVEYTEFVHVACHSIASTNIVQSHLLWFTNSCRIKK